MPHARASRRQHPSFPGYLATTGTREGRAAADALPGHPLARHIDDFLTDLANANKPRNTIRAYRGDLVVFAAHYDGEVAGLTAAPVRAFLGEIAGQAPGHPQAQARRSRLVLHVGGPARAAGRTQPGTTSPCFGHL
jgi:hypothetical protein